MPYKCPIKRREASRKSQAKYQKKNKEALAAKNLERYHELYKGKTNTEERKAYMKKYREENKEKIKAYQRTPEQAEKARLRAKAYQKANPAKANMNSRLRKKRVRQATPDWVDRDKLTAIYQIALDYEEITGEKHHVDHIIPIWHDKICGLHVPNNLQAISASDNIKKSNSFEPYSIEH